MITAGFDTRTANWHEIVLQNNARLKVTPIASANAW